MALTRENLEIIMGMTREHLEEVLAAEGDAYWEYKTDFLRYRGEDGWAIHARTGRTQIRIDTDCLSKRGVVMSPENKEGE